MTVGVKYQRRGIAAALLVTLGVGAVLTYFVGRGGLSAVGRQLDGLYVSAASAAGVHVKQPVLVLAPGAELIVDGRPVKAFGFDKCPQNEGIMRALFGPGLDGNACIRLDREHVRVRTLDRNGTDKTSVWTVRHDGESVSILSEDGKPIGKDTSGVRRD